MSKICICGNEIQASLGHPYIVFKEFYFCQNCYLELIPVIYKMSGCGDGGLIHIIFKDVLQSNYNRKKRTTIKGYNRILKQLLHKYKFKCVICGSENNLTIDHIKPVSRGGGDNINNLQILCKSCNSRKGNKII